MTYEGTDEKIYPMVPYVDPKRDEFNYVPYDSFVDFKTSDYYSNTEHPDTQLYWKSLSEVLREYVNHEEIKIEGETSLHRRHIIIEKKNIRYLGKESSDLEEYLKLGVPRDAIPTFMNLGELILTLKPKQDAARVDLPESTIYAHEKMIRELEKKGKKFDLRILKKKAIEAYINYFK